MVYCAIQNKEKLAKRKIIERFETPLLQARVSKIFDSLKEHNWLEIGNPAEETSKIEEVIRKLAETKKIYPEKVDENDEN